MKNRIGKRLLALLLATVLLLSVVPTAFAEEAAPAAAEQPAEAAPAVPEIPAAEPAAAEAVQAAPAAVSASSLAQLSDTAESVAKVTTGFGTEHEQTTYYASLDAAFSNVRYGDGSESTVRMTLLQDLTNYTTTHELNSVHFTLDLNGHKVTPLDTACIECTGNSTVTVVDSDPDKNGSFLGFQLSVNCSGTLTLDGGSVRYIMARNGSVLIKSGVVNGPVSTAVEDPNVGPAHITIQGGKILGELTGDADTYTITGGVFLKNPTTRLTADYRADLQGGYYYVWKNAAAAATVTDADGNPVGGTCGKGQFDLLSDAVAAARDGDTVTLLQEYYTLPEALTIPNSITLNVGACTLALNSHAITAEGDLTITGSGELLTTSPSYLIMAGTGKTLTLDGGVKVFNTAYSDSSASTKPGFLMNGNDFHAVNAAFLGDLVEPGTVTLDTASFHQDLWAYDPVLPEGKGIGGGYKFSPQGRELNYKIVTIAEMTAMVTTGFGTEHEQTTYYASLDAAFSGVRYGDGSESTVRMTLLQDLTNYTTTRVLYNDHFTLDLNGHTVTPLGTACIECTGSGNVTVVDSDPDKNGSFLGFQLTVNFSGTLTLDGASVQHITAKHGAVLIKDGVVEGLVSVETADPNVGPAHITIQGGYFPGGISGDAGTYTITGGTFTAASKPSESYLATGYAFYERATASGTVYDVDIDDRDNPIRIGETNYATIEAALAAARDGDTLVFRRDYTGGMTMLTKPVKLDLNGKTVTLDGLAAFGEIQVMDAANGEGKLVVPESNFLISKGNNGGYLPLWDKENACYRFFLVELCSVNKNGTNKVSIFFNCDNMALLEPILLAEGQDAWVGVSATWLYDTTDMDVHYKFTNALLKQYMDDYITAGKAKGMLYVNFTKMDSSVKSITAKPAAASGAVTIETSENWLNSEPKWSGYSYASEYTFDFSN